MRVFRNTITGDTYEDWYEIKFSYPISKDM